MNKTLEELKTEHDANKKRLNAILAAKSQVESITYTITREEIQHNKTSGPDYTITNTLGLDLQEKVQNRISSAFELLLRPLYDTRDAIDNEIYELKNKKE